MRLRRWLLRPSLRRIPFRKVLQSAGELPAFGAALDLVWAHWPSHLATVSGRYGSQGSVSAYWHCEESQLGVAGLLNDAS